MLIFTLQLVGLIMAHKSLMKTLNSDDKNTSKKL